MLGPSTSYPRPGDRDFFREVGPARRRYQLYVPTSHGEDRSIPLVLDLHTWRGTAQIAELFNGFANVADEAGFVLARPEAVSPGGDAPPSWKLFEDEDASYVEAVVADVQASIKVDPARIYAAGMSQGGQFAIELTSRRSAPFAAVASVAVLAHPVARAPRPTPLIAFLGRKDPIYDLGVGLDPSIFDAGVLNPPPGARPGPLGQEAGAWASVNGCGVDPVITGSVDGIERMKYQCPVGVDIEIFIHDGGHVWPGPWLDPDLADELELGPATAAIDATRTIWAFFERHPRRERGGLNE